MKSGMHALQLLFVLAMFALTNSAVAEEGCEGGPKSQWKSVDDVKSAAIEHNYHKIAKVILEDGCYEVVTINDDGKLVGVHFDPVTLELKKVEKPR